jgi:hypothetical protein
MVVSSKNSAASAALLSALLVVACSSSSKGTPIATGGSGGSTSPGTAGGTATGPSTVSDTKAVGSDLTVVFSPMYSGFDGSRTFKVPAIVSEVTGARWSASDISFVDLSDDAETGGVMITTRKSGVVNIIARAGALSGQAALNITQFAAGDCDAGDMRYHNSIGIDAGGLAIISGTVPDNASCADCHGDGAQMLSIQHTPQQTGGFSDMDLINIFTKGFKPNGSVFITMFPPQIYQRFHTWSATDAEKTGLVCYLRSIEPKSQGTIDFSGLRPGGMMGMRPPMGGAAGAGMTAGGAGASAQAGAGGQ